MPTVVGAGLPPPVLTIPAAGGDRVELRVVVEEDQTAGQHIIGVTVETLRRGGGWTVELNGESVGHKRIVPVAAGAGLASGCQGCRGLAANVATAEQIDEQVRGIL